MSYTRLVNSFRDDQFLNLKWKNNCYIWRDVNDCTYCYRYQKPFVIKKTMVFKRVNKRKINKCPAKKKICKESYKIAYM